VGLSLYLDGTAYPIAGLPSGGTTDQAPLKTSSADGAVTWADIVKNLGGVATIRTYASMTAFTAANPPATQLSLVYVD